MNPTNGGSGGWGEWAVHVKDQLVWLREMFSSIEDSIHKVRLELVQAISDCKAQLRDIVTTENKKLDDKIVENSRQIAILKTTAAIRGSIFGTIGGAVVGAVIGWLFHKFG